jgi:hypothetical protein
LHLSDGLFKFVVLFQKGRMLRIKEIIHVGGYWLTPGSIGLFDGNFPTWCSEGSSSSDLSRTKKPTIIYQTNLSEVSAGSVLTVTTCDLMILSAKDKRVKARYLKREKGRTSDNDGQS